jgi:hypothetical protein
MIQANSVSLFSETMPQVNGGATMTRELRRAAIKLRGTSALWYSLVITWLKTGRQAGRGDEYRT